MPRRYSVYRGNRKVGEVWEQPDWEGEIVGFVLSWALYLFILPFALVFRALRDRERHSGHR